MWTPQSQEINPADSGDEDFNVSRQSTFEKLNDFFDYKNLTNPGKNVMFILSDGDFRFSHYSIQEFLVAKYIRENQGVKSIGSIVITDFIWKMMFKIEWVKIPAGKFQMGSNVGSDEAVHTVSLDSF
jgi:formylglycine-generating enzyme required for sulfatase activity